MTTWTLTNKMYSSLCIEKKERKKSSTSAHNITLNIGGQIGSGPLSENKMFKGEEEKHIRRNTHLPTTH